MACVCVCARSLLPAEYVGMLIHQFTRDHSSMHKYFHVQLAVGVQAAFTKSHTPNEAKVRKIKIRLWCKNNIHFDLSRYRFDFFPWNQLISQMNLCLAGASCKLNFAQTQCAACLSSDHGILCDRLQFSFAFEENFRNFY